jgi:hypothetical protein
MIPWQVGTSSDINSSQFGMHMMIDGTPTVIMTVRRRKGVIVVVVGTILTALVWMILYLSLVAYFWHVATTTTTTTTLDGECALSPTLGTLAWMMGQWSPAMWSPFLNEVGWKSFERTYGRDCGGEEEHPAIAPLDIPTLDLTLAAVRDNPLEHLLHTYGDDWIHRPLLLQGVWSQEELQDPTRRLSISRLAQDPLVVPYFSDARQLALTPDSEDTLIHILQGIRQGRPHKIGSQEYIKAYPDRLDEVAPPTLISTLFGNRFTVDRLLGHIHSPWSLLQGPLTVPIFVANANIKSPDTENPTTDSSSSSSSTCPTAATATTATTARPFTGLHCEPIGNISVQLAGAREWTLVQPTYWTWLRPSVSPDGRGFFASWAPTIDHVPRYRLRTLPGDAVWVPPWTWHRVDYVMATTNHDGNDHDDHDDDHDDLDGTVSLGASLFHFRPVEFVTRNPIFALLLAPYLAGELLGTKTQ